VFVGLVLKAVVNHEEEEEEEYYGGAHSKNKKKIGVYVDNANVREFFVKPGAAHHLQYKPRNT